MTDGHERRCEQYRIVKAVSMSCISGGVIVRLLQVRADEAKEVAILGMLQ